MSLYNGVIKEHGGIIRAKKKTKDWLKSELKTVNLSMDIKKYKNRMEAGKIYTFDYDPKLKGILSFYDKHPIVLSLGPSRQYPNLDLGINLNFLPPKYKLYLLSKIWSAYQTKIERTFKQNQKTIDAGKTPTPVKEIPLKFWYEAAKKFVPKQLGFALRSYYVDRRSNSILFSYNKWPEVALLELDDMEGITLQQAYRMYNKWLKANGPKLKEI